MGRHARRIQQEDLGLTLRAGPQPKKHLMIKPIKTAADHERALVRIGELMARNPKPGTSESDELEVLAQLTEAWEKPRYDLGNPSPVDAIRFVMEQRGLSRKDLVPCLGSLSRVSEVLSGKRPLTVQMMQRLHRDLGLPATVLLAEPAKEPALATAGKYPLAAMLKRGYLRWTGTVQVGR